MKIWFQTATAYRYDPLWDEYGKTLEDQCRKAARPDTEVFVTGVPVHVPGIDKFKSLMYYHLSQFMNHMLKAEKEGYSAFVLGCSFHVGLDEGREMLDIPVVSMTHTALHMASMMGERFAIVTSQPHIAERYRQMIVSYGLQRKHIQGSYYIPFTGHELAKALRDPAPAVARFRPVAERAVADGASVIIPVPAYISGLFHKTGGLNSLNGALVLDPVAVAVKFAEMLVDLKKIGIEPSRKPQVYGQPGRELLEDAFRKYEPVFRIEY